MVKMKRENNKDMREIGFGSSKVSGVKAFPFYLLAFLLLIAQGAFAVNVKTDRTWYLAGEAMTVRVTADDAVIAYAELCDTYGQAAGIMVSLQDGRGTGIIELPSNLHSGYYVLSVYTRNQAEVSHQLVAIVNPLHKSKDDDMELESGIYRVNLYANGNLIGVSEFKLK